MYNFAYKLVKIYILFNKTIYCKLEKKSINICWNYFRFFFYVFHIAIDDIMN